MAIRAVFLLAFRSLSATHHTMYSYNLVKNIPPLSVVVAVLSVLSKQFVLKQMITGKDFKAQLLTTAVYVCSLSIVMAWVVVFSVALIENHNQLVATGLLMLLGLELVCFFFLGGKVYVRLSQLPHGDKYSCRFISRSAQLCAGIFLNMLVVAMSGFLHSNNLTQ